MLSEIFNLPNFTSPKRFRVPAALLLIAISMPSHAKSSANTPRPSSPAVYGPASFIVELDHLKSGLDAARQSPQSLCAYRDSLPGAWTVESGAARYDVSTLPLLSRLDSAASDPALRQQQLSQARDYLSALSAETASLSGAPPADTISARIALDRILSRPEYANQRQLSWWDRFRERVDEMISNALLRIFRRIGGQKSLGAVLLWLGICAAAILLAYWVFRRWFRAARMQEMALQSAATPARSWQQWILSARAASGRQDYRLAIYCAYWAGIARLEDLGALPSDRASTPRENLRSLMKSKLILPEPHAARYLALSCMTSRLESIWYGYHMATEADFRDALHQLEILGCRLP